MASKEDVTQREQKSEDSANYHCWICLSEDTDDLISPCACKGSVGQVHESCLLEYIAHVCTSCCSTGDPCCPNCNTKYHLLLEAATSEVGGGPYDDVNVDEKARELGGFACVRKVFELIQTMPQGEDRTSMVREYSMHVLVQIIPLAFLASFSYRMLMYLIQDNLGELAPSPEPTHTPVISILQFLLPIAGSPTSLDQSSVEQLPHPKLQESGASGAWSSMFFWLQCVTSARALFFSFTMSNLADSLSPRLPCLPSCFADHALVLLQHANRLRQFILRDQEEESRILDFFLWLGLPLASMSICNILAKLADVALAYGMLPTVSCTIKHAVCTIFSSYTIVFITVLCDVVFLTRRTADLFVAAAEDVGRFRASGLCKQLQMGRVRVYDQGCQQ